MSASHQHGSTAPTRVRDRRPEPGHEGGGGLSLTTLTAASLASVVAAVVVSRVWGPGTLYGAAATPIIVTLVSELIQRPRRVIETARHVRPTRSFDPVAEGQQGLRDGELESATPPPAERTDHHRDGHRLPGGRRGLLIALATGLVAFAIGAFVLTSGELVFGSSQVGGGHSRTTLFGGKPVKKRDQTSDSQSTDKTKTQTDQQSTTKTTTQQDTTSKSTTPSATQTTTTRQSDTTTAPRAAPSAPGAGGQPATPSTTQTTTPTPTSAQPSAQAVPTTTSP